MGRSTLKLKIVFMGKIIPPISFYNLYCKYMPFYVFVKSTPDGSIILATFLNIESNISMSFFIVHRILSFPLRN